MSKSPKRRYDLAKVIEAELSKANPIDIVAGDEVFTVNPPVLWPDEVYRLSREGKDDEAVSALLGDRYEAFCAVGGTALLLFEIVKQSQGADLPE